MGQTKKKINEMPESRSTQEEKNKHKQITQINGKQNADYLTFSVCIYFQFKNKQKSIHDLQFLHNRNSLEINNTICN